MLGTTIRARSRPVGRHAEVVRRRGGRTIGGTNTGVILGATPAETDPRVTNGVSLHLVDRHLSGMAVHELHEATALARGDLDVCDLAKALEERPELVLSNITREATNEYGRVVGVGELVHLRGRVEAATVAGERLDAATPHLLLRRHTRGHHAAVLLSVTEAVVVTAIREKGLANMQTQGGAKLRIMHEPVLRCSSGEAHGTVATVDTLHLNKGALLVVLVREADETITTALARHGIRHDLSRLARRESGLEERNQDIFVDLRAKVTNENAVFRSTIITAQILSALLCSAVEKYQSLPTIHKATTRSPVELELTGRVGDGRSVQGQSLVGSFRGGELHEAVASVAVPGQSILRRTYRLEPTQSSCP